MTTVIALTLAGCGGSQQQSAPGRGAPAAEPGDARAADDADDAAGGDGESAARGGDQAGGQAGDQAGSQAREPVRDRDATGTDRAALPQAAPENRDIAYTATLRVRAQDVAAAASRATEIVSAAGGHVHDERTRTDPARDGGATASVTFKVPTNEYRVVLDDLGSQLGTRLGLEQRAEDLTEKVADVDARLKSARASLDRLRQLLAEAEEIGEVLSVEREIAQRESELESLEARQRTLANRTQYATVTLRLVGPEAAEEDRDHGFLAGLSAGWRAFQGAVGWLLTALGAVLPFLAVLGVLGYAAWRVRAAVRRRRTAPTPPS